MQEQLQAMAMDSMYRFRLSRQRERPTRSGG